MTSITPIMCSLLYVGTAVRLPSRFDFFLKQLKQGLSLSLVFIVIRRHTSRISIEVILIPQIKDNHCLLYSLLHASNMMGMSVF